MAIKVLVVDDSRFYRQRLCEIFNAGKSLQVVGTAQNGREAIDLTLSLKPDVITMDYEMPLLDGISAIREIMEKQPTPILMFSSLCYQGSRVATDAMKAGAADFMAKNFDQISTQNEEAIGQLRRKVIALVTQPSQRRKICNAESNKAKQKETQITESKIEETPIVPPPANKSMSSNRERPIAEYDLIVLGCSTGGPVALRRILDKLDEHYPVPIVIVQHMPDSFTDTFSQRLNQLSKVAVKEAEDGDKINRGTALVAPGGSQLVVDQKSANTVKVLRDEDQMPYSPSVDLFFKSVALHFKGKVLAVVLTGMGSDGKEGAKYLKNSGATIWAQDEKSCVVYGMPMAIVNAGLADQVLSLNSIATRLSGC